jgi:hypothetical protein
VKIGKYEKNRLAGNAIDYEIWRDIIFYNVETTQKRIFQN